MAPFPYLSIFPFRNMPSETLFLFSSMGSCSECWCSGVAERCTDANLYWSVHRLPIVDDEHGITVTDK